MENTDQQESPGKRMATCLGCLLLVATVLGIGILIIGNCSRAINSYFGPGDPPVRTETP
jgi:hypothetical protein